MRKMILIALAAVLLLSLAVCANAAEAFVYEDAASGCCLTLPQGWDLEYEEDAFVKVTFLPGDNAAARMQYGSRDLYSAADAKAKRESYDNSHYSADHVAELVGCTAKDVKRVTLKGTEYFRAVFEKNVPSGKFAIPLDMTYWVRYDNGWVYVYQYVGSDANPLYQQFKDMIVGAAYAETAPVNIQEDSYSEAVKAYEEGNLEDAEKAFTALNGYEDSEKYLRLLRIREAGGNTVMGGAEYDPQLALTQEQKQDIDDAAKDFAFADTAQVLLCSSDVATYYLDGLWSGSGVNCYLHFSTGEDGGVCRMGQKLSQVSYDRYTIENGSFLVKDAQKETVLLTLTLTAPDTLDVVSHAMDGQSFTLTRK